MYFLQVYYRNDNERKRLDYIINKWNNKVSKLDGYLLKIDDETTYKEIFNEISSKFPPELIKSYKAEELEVKPQTIQETKTYLLNKSLHDTKTFLNFIIAKNKGIYLGKTEEADIYDIYTRKGIVRTFVALKGDTNKTQIILSYEGTKEAVNKIEEEIEKEIKIFEEIR
ncbi:hypothetical protein [Acidianus manzaensis]|uniref:Uncharacterized protein n=1 Tax=Acidianus manzaensis TaxID=282676 RepID=A0A1W6K365_9CREN|nr:hypothetical protein [Acidianus manzaensis]ARM76973.1 hypothetical protein B6F84_13730 [Acidianus manzaensis]